MNTNTNAEKVLNAAGFRCQCAGPCTRQAHSPASVCGKTATQVSGGLALCPSCITGRAKAASTNARKAREAARGQQLDILTLITEIGA